MTTVILGEVIELLRSSTDLANTVIKSQTPDQAKIMWDRHIQLTQPLYDLVAKFQHLFDKEN